MCFFLGSGGGPGKLAKTKKKASIREFDLISVMSHSGNLFQEAGACGDFRLSGVMSRVSKAAL